ncbi:MMPL family transporter [Streptomyces violaceorubidus]
MIDSAAVVMISVFLAFVLSGERVIAMFGIALAASPWNACVLRTLLVPALMHLLAAPLVAAAPPGRPACPAPSASSRRVPGRPMIERCAAATGRPEGGGVCGGGHGRRDVRDTTG